MGETACVERSEIRGSRAVSGESSGFAILSGPSERSAMTLRLLLLSRATELWLKAGQMRGLPYSVEGRLDHGAIRWRADSLAKANEGRASFSTGSSGGSSPEHAGEDCDSSGLSKRLSTFHQTLFQYSDSEETKVVMSVTNESTVGCRSLEDGNVRKLLMVRRER